MRNSFKVMVTTVACTLFLGGAAFGQSSEKRIKMADLPPAVQKTVQEQSKGATVRGVSKEVEKGKTFYELETTVNGKSRDVLIDPSGAVVEIEDEVSLDSLPAAAREAIQKSAGDGKILKVESVRKGTSVTYEATVQKAGKKSEIAVKADGTVIP